VTQHLREDGTVIDQYWETDEDSHSTKEVCPMCDSDVQLTEEGVLKEEQRKKWQKEFDEIDDE
jgi:hypothetical protein